MASSWSSMYASHACLLTGVTCPSAPAIRLCREIGAMTKLPLARTFQWLPAGPVRPLAEGSHARMREGMHHRTLGAGVLLICHQWWIGGAYRRLHEAFRTDGYVVAGTSADRGCPCLWVWPTYMRETVAQPQGSVAAAFDRHLIYARWASARLNWTSAPLGRRLARQGARVPGRVMMVLTSCTRTLTLCRTGVLSSGAEIIFKTSAAFAPAVRGIRGW